MKTYVQFFDENANELCGSDSIFILDGRNKPLTWVRDAVKRAWYLRKVQNNIVYYGIIKGERIDHNNEVLCFHKIDKSNWHNYKTISDWVI